MKRGTKYGFSLSLTSYVEQLRKQALADTYKKVAIRIGKLVASFVQYYQIYRPVPSGTSPGVVGKYSKGTYMENLEIFFDGVFYTERLDDLTSGRYIPDVITIRNHTHSPKDGFRYSDLVEYHGWNHRSPYSPIRKALEKVRGDYNFSFSTEKYGKTVARDNLNKVKYIRKKPGLSMTKGTSIKTQLSRKRRKSKK